MSPEDVVGAVVFLASNKEARLVTGASVLSMPAKRSGARRSFLGVRERPGTVVRRRVAEATWPDGSPLTLPILVATEPPDRPCMFRAAFTETRSWG